MRYFVELAGRRYDVDVTENNQGQIQASTSNVSFSLDTSAGTPGLPLLLSNYVVDAMVDGSLHEGATWSVRGRSLRVHVESERSRATRRPAEGLAIENKLLCSPIPGRIVLVKVAPGDPVERGDPLVVIEAMKMENELRAPVSGMVGQVFVQAGQTVEAGAKLVKIE